MASRSVVDVRPYVPCVWFPQATILHLNVWFVSVFPSILFVSLAGGAAFSNCYLVQACLTTVPWPLVIASQPAPPQCASCKGALKGGRHGCSAANSRVSLSGTPYGMPYGTPYGIPWRHSLRDAFREVAAGTTCKPSLRDAIFKGGRLSEPQKTHWVRCLKPYSPKPYSARFRL